MSKTAAGDRGRFSAPDNDRFAVGVAVGVAAGVAVGLAVEVVLGVALTH